MALVCAVAYDPDLLLLDESTNRLNALARETFFSLLAEDYADRQEVGVDCHQCDSGGKACLRFAGGDRGRTRPRTREKRKIFGIWCYDIIVRCSLVGSTGRVSWDLSSG
ncbi:MAG: hypothetical protein V2G42_03645 [bacterium JZ-2024 1]